MSSMPPPIGLPPAKGWAVEVSRWATSGPEADGWREKMRAAVAATSGAAKEVPLQES
jgi:hypothetical protein